MKMTATIQTNSDHLSGGVVKGHFGFRIVEGESGKFVAENSGYLEMRLARSAAIQKMNSIRKTLTAAI